MRIGAGKFFRQRMDSVGCHVESRAEAELGCRSQVVAVDSNGFPGGNYPDRGC